MHQTNNMSTEKLNAVGNWETETVGKLHIIHMCTYTFAGQSILNTHHDKQFANEFLKYQVCRSRFEEF